MEAGDTFYSPMIRSETFGEPVFLDCELHSLSQVPPHHLGGTGKVEAAEIR